MLPLILEPIGDQPRKATVIFFTTTANEALYVPPLCNPAKMLQEKGIRVISFDLPFHDDTSPSYEKVSKWVEYIEQTQKNPLEPFLEKVQSWLSSYLDPKENLAFMGISRGAYIAALLSLKMQKLVPLVLFSPMIHLDYPWLWRDAELKPDWLHQLNLQKHVEFFKDSSMFIFIGNHDERVQTNQVCTFYEMLTARKGHQTKRGVNLNLRVFPSIGMYGHGTPDDIFLEGVNWVLKNT